MSEALSSRFFVVGRDTLYQSPVTLTPYSSEVRIDEQAIGKVIEDAYVAAGVHPDEVDTGSVILTGEALRRENAQAIGRLLAESRRRFLLAPPRPHQESNARRPCAAAGERPAQEGRD